MRDFRHTALATSILPPVGRILRRYRRLWSLLPPLGLEAMTHGLSKRGRKVLSTRYSLVVACYNVEKYIDDFFELIFSQRVDLKCLEIITVDDGSTDGTASRITCWQRRYPGCIRLLRQPNQGQAAARNAGLAYATGDWVGFPDLDDFSQPVILPSWTGRSFVPIVQNCRWFPAI